jgi:tetratricopeptide (TPR) repeat protein
MDVRSVFSWSYQRLSPLAARLFRLLGLHAGPDIALPAAASLCGLPTGQVRRLLTELARAHLVNEHTAGRFTFHDLLRAYAGELAGELDSDTDRQAARQRVLDHYVHTAYTGALLLDPRRDLIELAPAEPGVVPEELADPGQALTWFTAEQPVLLAALDQAEATGFDRHTWQLAWTLATFLDRQGYWRVQAATQQAALAATRRLGDRAAQAHAHRGLARAYTLLGNEDKALAHHQHALDLYEELGDLVGQAQTRLNLAMMFELRGPFPIGLAHAQQALELYRAAGHRTGRARSLNSVGWFHALCGDYHQALTCCAEAVMLLEELGDRRGQAATWDSLGYAHHHLGDHAKAVAAYRRSLELYRDAGERRGEGICLEHLAETHELAGDHAAAQQAWRESLTILEQLDHPDAAQVRARLSGG